MFTQEAREFLPEILRGYYWCRSNGSLLQRDCTLALLWRIAESISPVAPLFCSELDLGHININFIFPNTGRYNIFNRNSYAIHSTTQICKIVEPFQQKKIFNIKDKSTPKILQQPVSLLTEWAEYYSADKMKLESVQSKISQNFIFMIVGMVLLF